MQTKQIEKQNRVVEDENQAFVLIRDVQSRGFRK